MPETTIPPDVPWDQLAWLAVGGLAAVLGTVVAGLLFLRAATSVEELRST
ncbi:hypothetical protein QTS76_32755 [Micromonospora sp. b486]|nr:hypothetical protein [Micromonospora sp. b486]MDM4783951.1 hypothetical protein [Micromonospora sp. b486]